VICTPSPSGVPSPSKSQRYVSGSPSGSDDAVASKVTVSFLRGFCGDTENAATGRASTVTDCVCTEGSAGSSGSSSVSLTVRVPGSAYACVTSPPVAPAPSPKAHVQVTGAAQLAWAVKVAVSPGASRPPDMVKSAGASASASPAVPAAAAMPTTAAIARRRAPCLLIREALSSCVPRS
jgi:hypothetical protein